MNLRQKPHYISGVFIFNIYDMSFQKKLKRILDNDKPKKFMRVCNNFWCKGRYEVFNHEYQDDPSLYGTCPKCRSFDTELSGGVTNNGQRRYEGERFDNEEHEVTIKQHQIGLRR